MPDHSGVTSGSGDHAEMAVPLSQRPQGTTNRASAGQDTGDGKNDLRAEMVEALRLAAQTRPEDLGLSEHEQWYVDFNCVDCDADTLYAVLAHGLAAAGWRPPLPVMDVRTLISVVGGLIDEIAFGDDNADLARTVAKALLDGGWLDKTGAVGPPEPVATTLRRVIADLESAAAYELNNYAAWALRTYALRLRGHPALDAVAEAGWPPLLPSGGQLVYVVEHEDVGAVCAFATDRAAKQFIEDDDGVYEPGSLSVTIMAVER